MGCTFFTSFLCNSCNFQYYILGWPTLVSALQLVHALKCGHDNRDVPLFSRVAVAAALTDVDLTELLGGELGPALGGHLGAGELAATPLQVVLGGGGDRKRKENQL